jgi:hypothetical protein
MIPRDTYRSEALAEVRERFVLSDQQLMLLQVTKAAMESNVSPPPESNN